jgi:hypothetical protein
VSTPVQLLIETAPHAPDERQYALRVLLTEWLGLTYTTSIVDGLADTRIRLASDPEGAAVVLPDVLLTPATEWLSSASVPVAPLPTAALPDWTGAHGTVPILFPTSPGRSDLAEQAGDEVRVGFDLLGSVVFLLTRYEEHAQSDVLDDRDRFPGSASLLGRSGWLRWPVLDIYVYLFQAILRRTWPRLDLDPTPFRGVALSHDVDHPSSAMRWRGSQRLRILAGDVLRRRDPSLSLQRAASFLGGTDAIASMDPYNSYDLLMGTSERVGVASTFFFLTIDTQLPEGTTYQADAPWARRLMANIAGRQHHIGLHGSYNSSRDADRLSREWAILERAASHVANGSLRRAIRQHYLRWTAGTTWRAQAAAGFELDESTGFADRIGYRAGTARTFPAYDLVQHRELPLQVRPLHVMDVTFLAEFGDDPSRGIDEVAAMAQRTRLYGGDLSILWHNSTLETGASRSLYTRIVDRAVGT